MKTTMVRGAQIARVVLATSVSVLAAMSALQCSASSDGGGSGAQGGVGASGGSGGHSGTGASSSGGYGAQDVTLNIDSQLVDYSADQFYANDPPPQACDGGGVFKTPGGTPECPDDKNLQGCPCTQQGQTAACWPGYRKNRNRGDCKDGTTTCTVQGENKLVWGPCQGFTGIDPNTFQPLGTTGKAACLCFSGGYWDISNLSPCFISDSANVVQGAVSTTWSGSAASCPDPNGIDFNNPVAPTAPWSPDTVKADCTGFFKLCYTLKAYATPNGDAGANDCVMKQICTQAHLDQANTAQSFPDLGGWITQNSAEKACAAQFVANGGYGEMSVEGQSDECDQVPQKVFQTVKYCPLACNGPNPPAECANCKAGGGGPF